MRISWVGPNEKKKRYYNTQSLESPKLKLHPQLFQPFVVLVLVAIILVGKSCGYPKKQRFTWRVKTPPSLNPTTSPTSCDVGHLPLMHYRINQGGIFQLPNG